MHPVIIVATIELAQVFFGAYEAIILNPEPRSQLVVICLIVEFETTEYGVRTLCLLLCSWKNHTQTRCNQKYINWDEV